MQSLRQWFLSDHKTAPALVVLPTGGGKSGVAVLSAYLLNASRVLVITPSSEITSQIYRDFWYERSQHTKLTTTVAKAHTQTRNRISVGLS